ncbi:iron dicitrate transport regulator FecR [Leptolyngbyaceae cyanobacterium CCMR0082]|uniref:Iron dicitrate transport regulator FecR n=3 Tax=Adonisia TaxID=2950183 RepID=A0A6M0S047_9CYAN|nr:iron dicitrate transport regulator FecR [Adonisia turfae CCMR0081]NEZ61301.1 iron dicitrate transport regulator FecR [Adonisia turfae CCMR0082]
MKGLNRNMLSRYLRPRRLVILTGLAVVAASISLKTDARPLSVRVNRWLELRSFSGTVDVRQSSQWGRAQSGQRLGAVGDGIRTGAGSLARLAVDTQVGFVSVSENTLLSIIEFYTTPRGGKVTELDVSRGQARVFVRPFTNPDSRLEIRTPAGINGVRGTNFGIAIQPSGRSSLVVEEGSVASEAQGVSVPVNAGFQNFTIPGEPPSEPVPITEEPNFNLLRLERQRREDESIVVVEGNTFPVNLLVIEEETQEIDTEGNFALELPLSANRRIEATVVTPLGKTQIYELVVP